MGKHIHEDGRDCPGLGGGCERLIKEERFARILLWCLVTGLILGIALLFTVMVVE